MFEKYTDKDNNNNNRGQKMNNSKPLEHKQRCVTSAEVTGDPFINTINRMCPTPLPTTACFQV
jgi:hypothetical protein